MENLIKEEKGRREEAPNRNLHNRIKRLEDENKTLKTEIDMNEQLILEIQNEDKYFAEELKRYTQETSQDEDHDAEELQEVRQKKTESYKEIMELRGHLNILQKDVEVKQNNIEILNDEVSYYKYDKELTERVLKN